MRTTERFAGVEHDSAGHSVVPLMSVLCDSRGCTVWEHGILTFGNTGESSLWEECGDAQPWSPGLHAVGVKRMKESRRKKLKAFITAAAAAKSLQSCPTLCDPRDGSPPGSAVPGILQARTLEWVAISFSNA